MVRVEVGVPAQLSIIQWSFQAPRPVKLPVWESSQNLPAEQASWFGLGLGW